MLEIVGEGNTAEEYVRIHSCIHPFTAAIWRLQLDAHNFVIVTLHYQAVFKRLIGGFKPDNTVRHQLTYLLEKLSINGYKVDVTFGRWYGSHRSPFLGMDYMSFRRFPYHAGMATNVVLGFQGMFYGDFNA